MSGSEQLIAESINRIFSQSVDRAVLDAFESGLWPADLWERIEQNGFHEVLDNDGEAAPDWQEAQPVLFALGYHRVPLPLGETLLANWLCARAGLPVADGPATVVDGANLEITSGAGGALSVSGSVARVPWARFCDRLVIAGAFNDQSLIAVVDKVSKDPQHLRIEQDRNLAAEPRDTVQFCECPLRVHAASAKARHNPVRLYGALIRATSMAGVANSVLDQSVQYVNDRVQFGRPLAKFQAVQQMLADLATEVAAATMASTSACAAAGSADAFLDIAVAKVRAGQMALRVPRIAHQVHGAMGFTHEHSLHFGTRRLWSWREEFGNDVAWAREIGLAAIAAGGQGLWPDIMTR